jgi:hypothetical protein
MTSIRFHCIALPFLVLGPLVGITGSTRLEAGYIDSINPNAMPEDFATSGFNSVGWYYTPSQDYSLTGISTFFAFTEFGSGSRTVTVQIQSDTPANGGVVLDQGTLTASGTTDTVVGESFASPLLLSAGTTYFVDFLDVQGLGSNVGQWADVNGVHAATNGATTRLDAFYFGFGSDFSFASSRVGDAADESNGYGSYSGVEPILLFSGMAASSVPEPSSLILLAVGVAGLVVVRTKRIV